MRKETRIDIVHKDGWGGSHYNCDKKVWKQTLQQRGVDERTSHTNNKSVPGSSLTLAKEKTEDIKKISVNPHTR